MQERTYEITERPATLGGGWNLKLYEDGDEAGGGVFPLPQGDPKAGIDWWNAMTEDQRSQWLTFAGTAVPADAWHAYLADEAYADALEQGESWSSPPHPHMHP